MIFEDTNDKRHFIKILNRHLDPNNKSVKEGGATYRKFNEDIEIVCYCLMGNHFHLLVYVHDNPIVLGEFMKVVLTAYTMYFNKRYKRVGGLFQGVYKASRIRNDEYLLHISRYIHLNPRTCKSYRWSSLPYYCGAEPPVWLRPRRVIDLFDGDDYMQFLEDYEDHKNMLEEIKQDLADT
jgi:putative transposase